MCFGDLARLVVKSYMFSMTFAEASGGRPFPTINSSAALLRSTLGSIHAVGSAHKLAPMRFRSGKQQHR